MEWIEAQWNDNNQCDSAPNLILSFSTPDYYSDQKSFKNYNKSFPTTFFLKEGYTYPIGSCGLSALALPDDKLCCTSWLNTYREVPQVKSAANILIQNDTDPSQVIKSAQGTSYCKLYPQSGSIFQYSSIMIKNDGSCNPIRIFNASKASFAYISCNEKSVFSIYDTTYCGTPKKSYNLPITFTDLAPKSNISASLSMHSEGNMSIGWIFYFPTGLLVPILDNAPEVFALLFGVLAILIFVFCTIMAAFKWRKQKHSTDRLSAINYGLFAINSIIAIIIDNTSFHNNNCNYNCSLTMYNAMITNSIFAFITQLVLVMHSGMILFRILNASKTVRIITGVSIIAMSIITNGGPIAKILLLIIGEYYNYKTHSQEYLYYFTLATGADSWVTKWNQISPYWNLFMFCWNIIPMNIALFQIANRKKKYTTFLNALNNVKTLDKKSLMAILNMMHISVIISYYILSYFLYNTKIFLNDRTQLAARSLVTSCIAYHCILNYFFTERVKTILSLALKSAHSSTMDKSKKSKHFLSSSNKLTAPENIQLDNLLKVDQESPTIQLYNGSESKESGAQNVLY